MLWEMQFFHDMWYEEMGERTVVGMKGITKINGVDTYEDPDSEAWHYMCYTFYKPYVRLFLFSATCDRTSSSTIRRIVDAGATMKPSQRRHIPRTVYP